MSYDLPDPAFHKLTTAVPTRSGPGKRKSTASESHSAESERSKAKKAKKSKSSLVNDETKPLLGKLDAQLLGDYLARKTKRFEPDLSPLELEDRRLPAAAIYETTDWQQDRDLKQLPDFLREYASRNGAVEKLSRASKETGSPHTLMVCSAGIRAADVTRALRIFEKGDGVVAKLFAKHIKIAEATKFVKETRISIGVGTPARIIALLDSGALKIPSIKQIVVDCSYVDIKSRGILDIGEIQRPLIQLLNRADLRARYGGGKDEIKLLFF